jgi:hypothetical protein
VNAAHQQDRAAGERQLTGTTSDDGLPGPVTLSWSKVSGPGTVNFGKCECRIDERERSAVFGTYVLG